MDVKLWSSSRLSRVTTPWLVLENSGLGCTTCKSMRGHEHVWTKTHLAAAGIFDKAKTDTLAQAIVNSQSKHIARTARVQQMRRLSSTDPHTPSNMSLIARS